MLDSGFPSWAISWPLACLFVWLVLVQYEREGER